MLKVAVPAVKEAVQKARAEAEAQEAAARRAAERQELRRLGRLEVAGVPSPTAKAGSPSPASVETPVAVANDDIMVILPGCPPGRGIRSPGWAPSLPLPRAGLPGKFPGPGFRKVARKTGPGEGKWGVPGRAPSFSS